MEKREAAYIEDIIDGEGSITLIKMHHRENRRPCISISSTDKELLFYIQDVVGSGTITNKKNYKPVRHKDSYTHLSSLEENRGSNLHMILEIS